MNELNPKSINLKSTPPSTSDFIGRSIIDRDLCDRLIDDYENRKNLHHKAHSTRGYWYCSSMDMDCDLITEYEQQVYISLMDYERDFPYCREGICSYQIDFPFNVQKYYPYNHYSVWHCENNGQKIYRNRHLAFMTYLNTVEDGGETEFLHQNLKIKPEKGLTLIWPAGFTHTHRGSPSKTEEKYIVTGWFTFFDTDSFLETNIDATNEEFFARLEEINRKVS